MTGLGSSCGACKFLRRKCTSDCVFAPYFCYDQAANHFAAVHKVFGASNVSKLLLHLPVHCRSDAAITVSYEALARMRDPIHGCVAHIFALQQQVASLQEEIQVLGDHMANLTVGIAEHASSQRTTLPSSEAEISLDQDSLIMQYYPNQSAEPLNQSGHTTGSQDFDSKTNVQVPSPYGWEGLNTSCDSHPCPIEQLLEGVDKDIFTYYSWLNSESNII